MIFDLLVKNARLLGRAVDLAVAGGRIATVEPAAATQGLARPAEARAATVIDAAGAVLLPSLIDAHTHLRDPGQEYKEDIASGLAAAAYGGFGRVLCMANTRPVNDSASITEAMLHKARQAWPNGPFLHPIGALTMGLKGQELTPMADLAAAGCVAFSNDGLPVADSERFRRAMEYAASVGKLVIDHCEDPSMAPGAGITEGPVSSRLGLRGQPDMAEALQVAGAALLAEYLELPVHIAHVSCAKAVEIIRQAKAKGLAVSAETCPHYLFLTQDACEDYNTLAKVSPPLRTQEDVEALRQALKDGTIDLLATDHAPHAADEKDVEFELAPNGISGLDTALAWTWRLVTDKVLSEANLHQLWHQAPARLFGFPVNAFQPGDPADFILFDHRRAWVVGPQTMRSKSANTPLAGQTLQGRVVLHVLGGAVVVRDI